MVLLLLLSLSHKSKNIIARCVEIVWCIVGVAGREASSDNTLITVATFSILSRLMDYFQRLCVFLDHFTHCAHEFVFNLIFVSYVSQYYQ